MFYFDKADPRVLFLDQREEEYTLCDGRTFRVKPDMLMDFRNLDLPDNHFRVVIFDPPHLTTLGKNSYMAKKYGRLGKDWKADLKAGFDECWRVLEPEGVLVFKWNEHEIKVGEVLSVFGRRPLIGHRTGQSSKTMWMLFFKSPEAQDAE
jgi:23S rRNA G2069 N7-methylase RlmK/C1962 C5-methylase RlmI